MLLVTRRVNVQLYDGILFGDEDLNKEIVSTIFRDHKFAPHAAIDNNKWNDSIDSSMQAWNHAAAYQVWPEFYLSTTECHDWGDQSGQRQQFYPVLIRWS